MPVHVLSAHRFIPDAQVKAATTTHRETSNRDLIAFRSIMPIQTIEKKSEVKNC